MVNPPNHVTPIGLTAALLLALSNTPLTQAAIVIDPDNTGATDVSPTYNGVDDPWGTFSLIVGETSIGAINVDAGSSISSFRSWVGRFDGSDGTVRVTGPGSAWDLDSSRSTLSIGESGNGTVTIEDGGSLTSGEAVIGRNAPNITLGLAGGSGEVTVTGSGSSWLILDRINIGKGSRGTLMIANGGVVVSGSDESVIGREDLAVGTVTVTGTGSTWDLTNKGAPAYLFTIGDRGSGTLNIENGGSVFSSDFSAIGYLRKFFSPDVSSGVVTVTGSGSSWNHDGKLIVGDAGNGQLTVGSGGAVEVIQEVIVGERATAVLDILGGGLVDITGDLTVGLFDSGVGTVNLTGGTLLMRGGDIIAGAGTVVFNFNAGRLEGVGTFGLDLSQQGGVLAPGNGVGATSISGTFSQESSASLQVELNGLLAGTDYDQLDVAGQVTLNGSLDVQVIGGYAPDIGNSFTILNSASRITGAFSSVIGGEGFDIRYGLNTITLAVQRLGDMNADGFVGIDDLNLILANWNQAVPAGSWLHGDPSGDGFVGVDDLNILLLNWNSGTPPRKLASSIIPEPGVGALFIMGVCVLLGRKPAN